MNSKKKGKTGELELVKLFKAHGFADARRTAQYCGNTGDAQDVILEERFHVECKRVEQLTVNKWVEQAENDHKGGTVPIVFYRQSKQPWRVILKADAFLTMLNYIRELESETGRHKETFEGEEN